MSGDGENPEGEVRWHWTDFGNGHGMIVWRGEGGRQRQPPAEWLRRHGLRVVARCQSPSGRMGAVFVQSGPAAQPAAECR